MCQTNFSFDRKAYLCLYEEGSKNLRDLDNKLLEMLKGIKHFHVHIPSIIQGKVLEKCGYFDTFPQHLTAVCSLDSSKKDKLERKNIATSNLEFNDYYLTPAACVHIYPMLEKKCICPMCYTTMESVYRYENGRFHDAERLWEFTVREFVFVGKESYVKQMLSYMKKQALELAKNYFPEAQLLSSFDNFYPTKENKIKSKLQLQNHLKDELVVDFEGRSIAIASFNYHNQHFSKPFNFDQNGEIVTGCVGFGMERWILCLKERNQKVV